MAKRVEEIILGIDVGKDTLEVFATGAESSQRVANEATAIGAYLGRFGAPLVLAVEATSDYHEEVVAVGLELGCEVYVVNGYRLSRYRDAVGCRAKTDRIDAQLIHRYLVSERSSLRSVVALPREERQLWRLLKRRATVVKVRTRLRESYKGLADCTEAREAVESTLKALEQLSKQLAQQAERLARALGWRDALARLKSVPGIGSLSALALQVMYRRGRFTGADPFIAFLGLDVRVRDSGRFRGQRKLTKKGDPEVRRLLFNAARSAAQHDAAFASLKAAYQARGLSETQVSVILARKLARIGFALLRDGTGYTRPAVTG